MLFNVSLGLSLGKVLFALVYPYEKITPWEGLLHDVKATKELAKSKVFTDTGHQISNHGFKALHTLHQTIILPCFKRKYV